MVVYFSSALFTYFIYLQIHSKKRNRLEHQNLQDLVYIKYNQALKERFNCDDVTNPIQVDEFLDDSEWVLGEGEGGFDDDDDYLNLTEDVWGAISRATGAEEPITPMTTRSEARASRPPTSTRPSSSSARTSSARPTAKDKGKSVVIEDDEEDEWKDDESEEEEEEVFEEESQSEDDD